MNFSSRSAVALVLVSLGVSTAVGCAQPDAEESLAVGESNIVSRVQGSTLSSAYAKPTATYLSVRNLSTLEQVGALSDQTVGAIAHRVDGIIANQPADGRVSIQELLKIESPGFIETLFPEEKAALPKVWALLETTAKAPKNTASIAKLPDMAVTDLSKPAGTLSQPTVLQVSELPAALQAAARRIQLTHDVDGSDDTITLADVNGALANQGPYTPDEVSKFQQIAAIFVGRAKSSIVTRAQVPAPFAKTSTLSAIGATTKLIVSDSLSYRETRSVWFSNPSYPEGATRVSFEATLSRNVTVEANPGDKLVAIYEDTERDELMSGNTGNLNAGVVTFEVWSNGARKTIERVKFAKAVNWTELKVDMSAFADFDFVAGNAPLHKNVVKASSRGVYNAGTSWDAEFTYGTTQTPMPAGADATALMRVSTPTNITAGRYEVDAGSAGKVRIDVSPSGVVDVTRLKTGATMRAPLHTWREGIHFHAHFPDRFRVMINSSNSTVRIFFDGQSVLTEKPLRAEDRTG